MNLYCLLVSKARSSCLLLFFLLPPLLMLAQSPGTREIKGTVTASKGGPAAGITVTVKGTKQSVATAANGSFSINAKPGDVLVFSGIAFEVLSLKSS